ncbi:MAG: TetR/AcrR family transcriptional regulator [Bacteroidales bacterium]|nr:TetR/AcrR family transcriptional regulator [Bacteroidales bacterium]
MNIIKNVAKYKAMMQTAHDLFWKHGFKRVTIEEVCRKANISKMTFYKYYPNKLELAKAVFDAVVEGAMDKFKNLMTEDLTVNERMHGLLTLKMEGTADVSHEFIQDFYRNPDLGLSTYIEQKTNEYWQNIIEDFRSGQNKGWFREDFKPEIILFAGQKLIELANDEKVQQLYANPQELIMELANLIAYGISPRN